MSDINERVSSIKNRKAEQEKLIIEYQPFIVACASKASGKFIDNSDDEASIALSAFNEAINAYDLHKGSFLTFANMVISRRVIDYLRKEKRYAKRFIPLNDIEPWSRSEPDPGSGSGSVLGLSSRSGLGVAEPKHDSSYRQRELKLEIKQFESELKLYNITFRDLVASSPKAEKTKLLYLKISSYISGNPVLLKKLTSSYLLPIKDLENVFKVPRKRIERGRKYIIAAVLILSGDYDYLKEYVRLLR